MEGDGESGNTASMNDDVKAKPGATVTKTQEHRKGNFMRCPGPGSEVPCHSSLLELIIISTCGGDSTRKGKIVTAPDKSWIAWRGFVWIRF